MGEAVLTILIALGVVAGAAVLFGGWLIWSAGRFVGRLIGGVFVPSLTIRLRSPPEVICQRADCQAPNPPAARFCRRCGRQLNEVRTVRFRHVALW